MHQCLNTRQHRLKIFYETHHMDMRSKTHGVDLLIERCAERSLPEHQYV